MTATSLAKLSVEDLLLPVLVQLAVIVAAARVFGLLARRLKQPTVVGEILAGILLGPSLFGALFPQAFDAVFHPGVEGLDPKLADAVLGKIFAVLAQLGLILLLFLVGLEFDFEHLRVKGSAALAVMLAGIVLPFACGAGLAPMIHPHLEPHPQSGVVPLTGLTLFLGTALSITALPVLGRILIELGIQRTRLAVVVITAAAIGDAVGWILLASVSALSASRFSFNGTLTMIALTIGFAIVMQFVIRPLALGYFRRALDRNGELTLTSLTILLVLLLAAAVATNLIGIFAIFGAFLLGAVVSDEERLRTAVNARLRDFISAFFVPVFFTYTGLRTEVSALDSPERWLIAISVIVIGFAAKFVGCGVAASLTGFSRREATIIGGLMNTRGLMELIVINVGYDLGVIPKSLFCTLVIMAILSNLLAAPIAVCLRRGTELEAAIETGPFLR